MADTRLSVMSLRVEKQSHRARSPKDEGVSDLRLLLVSYRRI